MNKFESGKWLVNCSRCGFRRYNDQVVKTWDGLIVCSLKVKQGCFESRHPQDFVRSTPDNQSVPYTGGSQDLTAAGQPIVDGSSTTIVAATTGVQERTIPTGTFTSNNNTL